ncbi:PAS domain-containing protein [Azorhizobium doebereinerae]|uniref:PAS domain-containing protein n=1 Tax=Azorhizobium doebereinerae TaxID=281091 RepID=UPI00042259ED|nr:PAS domain-containing protein [Azorhizobium doebereinerae]
MTVVAATPACTALGIEAGGSAPLGVKIVAKRVGMSLRRAPRLERVRLPFSLMPKAFACIAVHVPAGQVVLFADPLALASGANPARSLPGLTRLPVVTQPAAARAEGRSLRFTWAADEAGRLTRLSPPLAEALESAPDQWLGRDFDELTEAGLLADGAPMLAALRSGGSFFGLDLLSGGHPPRRLEFGGVPLLDAARRRRGTRGFGLLWGAAEDKPQRPPPAGLEAAPEEAKPFNVVPLRGGALTARERSAFHEIARTLTEAIEEWPKPALAAPAETDGATPMPAPADEARLPPADTAPDAGPMGADGEEHLLDRLPIGIVVQQGGATVRANRTLLGWLGARDTAEFIASGGLAPRLVRDARTGGLDLESLHGDRLPVEVRLVSSPWNGRPALVHVIRLFEGGANGHAAGPLTPPGAAPAAEADPGARQRERAAARQQTLDLIPFPILLLDRNGMVETANLAATDYAGFSAEEMADEPFTLLLTQDSHVEAVAMLDRAAAEGDGPQQATLTLRHRLGGRHHVDAMLAATGDARTRFCLIMRPAAEPAERHAAPAADPARQDGLARRLSHDIRDPLTVLLAFVESVQRNVFGPVGNRRYHQQADAAAAGKALLETLEDLDELALPPAASPAPLVLTPVIEAALAHAADAARRRRILLRSALPQDVSGRCGEAALARILRLLLEDALAATPVDGQVIVTLDEDAARDAVMIQIRDGGAALSEEEIAQALDPAAPAPVSDRFSRAGRPFRMARLAALARAQGAVFTLKRGVDVGMLAQIVLPR